MYKQVKLKGTDMLVYIQSVSQKAKIAKGCLASNSEHVNSKFAPLIVRFDKHIPEENKTYSICPHLAFVDDPDEGEVVLSHGYIDEEFGVIDVDRSYRHIK